jgi:outer membrane biosynthesis protein TonB
MGRRVATLWHATFSIAAGVLYFFFVLPRWPELMGDTTHTLGTAARIVAGVVIALAALPVVFTLLRVRKPEYGTPQLALTLLTSSIVAHVLAGVLIVGTAISEIWLNLDNVGQWLFAIYGAAAAIALLGIFAFYLSFVAELPPPPPKPVKPKKEKQRRRRRKKDGEAEETEAEEAAEGDREETTETPEESEQPAEVTAETEAESTAVEPESTAQEAPAVEDADVDDGAAEDTAAEVPGGGLRNRRPTGKSSGTHRLRRSRRGVAVED